MTVRATRKARGNGKPFGPSRPHAGGGPKAKPYAGRGKSKAGK
jgi:hypothetical protein